MIQLRRIEKTYQTGGVNTPVLRGIDLTIEEGEYVALMGPSGTGKSTLMNVLGLLDSASSGQYLFCGEEVTHLGDRALSRIRNQKIGFIFQLFHLLPRISALDNVLLPLLYSPHYPKDAKERGKALLRQVGLEDRIKFKPFALSGGQQQRVAVARALINAPALILADEPTGNLDQKAGAEILDLFDQLHSQGRTLVLVTHDPAVASRAKRIVTLRDGSIASDRCVA
jgi:putative ABC transport system ATP-binding protein